MNMKKLLILGQGVGVISTSEELITTHKLEEIYGISFLRSETGGMRWATPYKGTHD